MRRIGVSVMMTLAAAALCVGATPARPAPGGGIWLEGLGSLNSYAMHDVNNDDVAGLNRSFNELGLSFDKIESGTGLGVAVGVDLSRVGFGLGYERLGAATKSGVPLDVLVAGYETPLIVDYKLPATALRGIVEFVIPTRGTAGARVGVAGGLVSMKGSISASVSSMSLLSLDYSGKGPLFEVYGSGQWWAAPRVALTGSAGYRYAVVSEPKIEGVKVPGFSVDYSGFLVRAGVRLALTK